MCCKHGPHEAGKESYSTSVAWRRRILKPTTPSQPVFTPFLSPFLLRLYFVSNSVSNSVSTPSLLRLCSVCSRSPWYSVSIRSLHSVSTPSLLRLYSVSLLRLLSPSLVSVSCLRLLSPSCLHESTVTRLESAYYGLTALRHDGFTA